VWIDPRARVTFAPDVGKITAAFPHSARHTVTTITTTRNQLMRIAVFDYKMVPHNPIGGCHRQAVAGACDQHDFVVFATQFDNPRPDRIKFVRVPVPTRPLALLFVCFHLVAPICYLLYRLRHAVRFDLVVSVESNGPLFSDIVYSQFCHRRFRKIHWPQVNPGGLRGALRWMDHWFHGLLEPRTYGRATAIVVASRGLERELSEEYPTSRGKVHVIANPVDPERMRRPDDFDRDAARERMGLAPQDTVLLFVALGHFERKGLPLVLEAMANHGLPQSVKLNIVGGAPDLIATYTKKVEGMGLSSRVVFRGMHKDVREFFWTADAFVFPSIYEVFPLVALECAATGTPMLCTRLNGVEEFLLDGVNGIEMNRSVEGVGRAIRRLLALTPEQRAELGRNAQDHVRQYSVSEFQDKWRAVYNRCQTETTVTAAHVATR
jgi:glycosyltransferase involved in cell wall biosynthesis